MTPSLTNSPNIFDAYCKSIGKKLSGRKIDPFLLRLILDIMVSLWFIIDIRVKIFAKFSLLNSANLVLYLQLYKLLSCVNINFTWRIISKGDFEILGAGSGWRLEGGEVFFAAEVEGGEDVDVGVAALVEQVDFGVGGVVEAHLAEVAVGAPYCRGVFPIESQGELCPGYCVEQTATE